MDVGRYIMWLPLFFAVSCGFAADVQTFVISQARPQLPVMAAYLDIVDAGGQPVGGLVPADFSAVFGANSAQVLDLKPFQATGEGVAYVFLVDISLSIGSAEFQEMRKAIEVSIAGLRPADRAAIGTFGDDYQLLTDFTADKAKLTAAMEGLALHDMHTRLYQALYQAVELQGRIDTGLPVRRVIVVLSDGKDEGSALKPDDVLLQIQSNHLPIYSIGVSRRPQTEKQRYLDVLHRFSTLSGGLYEESGDQSVPQLYAAIQQAILRVFVIHLACPECPADGRSYPLKITLQQGTRGLEATPLNLIPFPGPSSSKADPPPPPHVPVEPSWWKRIPVWGWLIIALAALAGAGFAVLRRKQVSTSGKNASDSSGSLGSGDARSADNQEQKAEAQPGEGAGDEPKITGLPVTFTVVAGKNAGTAFGLKLRDQAVIGRGGDCDLVIRDDPRISNRHCGLLLTHGQVLVFDLASTNSTYVNGVPVRGRHKLGPRDTIRIGDTELRVHFEEP